MKYLHGCRRDMGPSREGFQPIGQGQVAQERADVTLSPMLVPVISK
jgi:hypothetical protein